jgi:hypothetical protein
MIRIETRIMSVHAFVQHDAMTDENKQQFSKFEKEVKAAADHSSVSFKISLYSFVSGIFALAVFIVRNSFGV